MWCLVVHEPQTHPTLPYYGMYNLACVRLVQGRFSDAEQMFKVHRRRTGASVALHSHVSLVLGRASLQMALAYMKARTVDAMLVTRCERGVQRARMQSVSMHPFPAAARDVHVLRQVF